MGIVIFILAVALSFIQQICATIIRWLCIAMIFWHWILTDLQRNSILTSVIDNGISTGQAKLIGMFFWGNG